MSRIVTVQLWTGSHTVRRLRFSATDQILYVEQMPDKAIRANLKRLGVDPMPATEEERELRLAMWPTLADLDQIATSWIGWNDGIRPICRVVDKSIAWAGETGVVAA